MAAFFRAFWEMPPVTRMYMAASVVTTMAVQLDIISPFQLYFNPKLIFNSHQYWRLITTFLFYGPLGFNFLFNLIFTYRYCRMLEEEFFRDRTADFFYMFLVGGTLMIMLAYFVNLLFLSHPFTIMLVYIWSRRNPTVRMNFFGLMNFQAPYLPWVLLAFTILLGSSSVVDIIGIIVGHFYYFFEDVFPNEPHGFRVLETPRFIKTIFSRLGIDEPALQEEDRPEQFNFINEQPNQVPTQANTSSLSSNNTNQSRTNDDTSIGSDSQPSTSQESLGDSSSPSRSTEPLSREGESEQQLRARNINSDAG